MQVFIPIIGSIRIKKYKDTFVSAKVIFACDLRLVMLILHRPYTPISPSLRLIFSSYRLLLLLLSQFSIYFSIIFNQNKTTFETSRFLLFSFHFLSQLNLIRIATKTELVPTLFQFCILWHRMINFSMIISLYHNRSIVQCCRQILHFTFYKLFFLSFKHTVIILRRNIPLQSTDTPSLFYCFFLIPVSSFLIFNL